MGYLTTITFRNDAYETFKKNPLELGSKICKALEGGYTQGVGENTFSLGSECNPVVIQKPRHADDNTIFVHMGNTVTEMNKWSQITKDLMAHHPKFFDDILKEMEIQVKALKKMRKEMKDEG